MNTFVLVCEECGTREAFGSDGDVLDSEWVDIVSWGTLDENEIAWHDGTCPECQGVDVDGSDPSVDVDQRVADFLDEHPGEIVEYKYGDDSDGVVNYLVGQFMSWTGGQADPGDVRNELLEQLQERDISPPEGLAMDTSEISDEQASSDDDGEEVDVQVIETDEWEPSVGDPVDIARADLPRRPKHEHKAGEISETDVDIRRAVQERRPTRPRSPTEAIFQQFFGRTDVPDEIALYATEKENLETTFHEVSFPSGSKGIYPEACIVPMPSAVL